MICFNGTNTNSIYYRALNCCLNFDSPITASRIGQVKSIGAACFELPDDDRLIFLNSRDINPFFAVIEAAWVISGRNDLKPLQYCIKNFSNYSDDDLTLYGAYGYRLRTKFNIDQIEASIELLSKSPNSRRVVLSIYSPLDLHTLSNDIPCNTQIYLKIFENRLDITVLNRSNDVYRGLPYNFFVFRTLQKHIAKRLGIECGTQRHVTDCLHIYKSDFEDAQKIIDNNTPSGIQIISKRLKNFDHEEIINNSNEIADLNFRNLSEPYKKLFGVFVTMRDIVNCEKKSFTLAIPQDFSFSLIAFNWFNRYQKLTTFVNTDTFTVIRKALAMNNYDDLIKSLWSHQTEQAYHDLKSIIANLNTCHDDILVIFRDLLNKSIDSLEPEQIQAFIILSVAISSIDPYVVFTDFGRERQAKLLKLAERFGIPGSLTIVSENIIDDFFNVIEKCENKGL
jgi:thymidylate synthase